MALLQFQRAMVAGKRDVTFEKSGKHLIEVKITDKTGDYLLTAQDGTVDLSELEVLERYDLTVEVSGALWGNFGNVQKLNILHLAAKAVS